MAYNSSGDPMDNFQYQYHHSYHYISDGGTIGGDESNFWPNSPSRSDSPSPNNMQNIGNTYQIFTPVGCSTPTHRYTPYRSGYATMSPDSDIPTHIPGSFVRVVKRRTTANKKERRRTQSINNAYADLRDCIPNVPADTKLSKIKTLRLATSYISYLTRALETDDPAGGFKAELGSISRKSNSNPVQVNDCTPGQASPRSDSSEDLTNSRKAKGRTGWPQHVWALELKQEQSL
ncbi:heart- and neural crest derivatives-expressed protein 2-like [Aethina tumida]|uniref:heart- and neural crest derivatives-expressed protein 2-like n=1 Tax=Aethina tumida TaxID=116153 RepID=UPI00096ADF4C|nr:heart- and neural crest derivatives-expressed protein 2-like [Aethina tumida]